MQQFPYLLLVYVFTFVLFRAPLFAQENVLHSMQWYASEKINAPLVISIYQTEAHNNFYSLLPKSKTWSNYNFLILEDDAFEQGELIASINDVLNEEKNYDQNRIYLILVGGEEIPQKYAALTLEVFAKRFHFYTTDSIITTPDYFSMPIKNIVLDDILQELSQEYLWQPDLDRIQEESKRTVFKKNTNRGIGIQLGWLSFQSNLKDGSVPIIINNFGINTFRILKPHWMYEFNLELGLSLPNPQDILQDQIRSQLDFNAILNGDDLEIDLNTTLKGHISAQLGLGVNYLFTPEKKWNPYAGLHLAFQNHILINTEIDTTIVIEGGLSGLGNNGFGGDGRSGGRLRNLRNENDNFDPTIFQYVTLSPKLGLQHHFNKRWFLDLNVQYLFDPKAFDSIEIHLNGLQFRAGLRYRFIGKTRTYYDYLRRKNVVP